jgi:anti-anti-sigma factor
VDGAPARASSHPKNARRGRRGGVGLRGTPRRGEILATTEPNAADTQLVGRLKIEIADTGLAPTVRLRGELGLDATPALEERLFALMDGGSEPLEIDLSELEFIDSSGLQTLLRVTRRARKAGTEPPRVFGANGQVLRVLELTGADRALSLSD